MTLKDLIIAKNPDRFAGIGPSRLTVYKTDIPIVSDNTPQKPELKPGDMLVVGKIATKFEDSYHCGETW